MLNRLLRSGRQLRDRCALRRLEKRVSVRGHLAREWEDANALLQQATALNESGAGSLAPDPHWEEYLRALGRFLAGGPRGYFLEHSVLRKTMVRTGSVGISKRLRVERSPSLFTSHFALNEAGAETLKSVCAIWIATPRGETWDVPAAEIIEGAAEKRWRGAVSIRPLHVPESIAIYAPA